MTELTFDYYYGVQAEQFAFYRIPRLLIKDPHFKGLSSDAKLLYGLMLDRMTLSMRNHWLDDENRAYIIYSINNVMEDLSCSKPTCIKIMKELDSFGLIERKRKGLGKPDSIYVKNFAVLEDNQNRDEEKGNCDPTDLFDVENEPVSENVNVISESREDELSEVKDFNFNSEESVLEMAEMEKTLIEKEKFSSKDGTVTGLSKKNELPEVNDFNFWNEKTSTSGGKEPLPLEVKNLAPNYNNNNYNNNNQNDNTIYPSNLSYLSEQEGKSNNKAMDGIDGRIAYVERIKKNLDYDFFMSSDVYTDKALLKELFDLICEVVCVKRKVIKVGGTVYPYEYVRSRFLELTSNHVFYVMDCMKETTTNIGNIKAYLITALFNAPSTIDHYYQQKVQHDLYSDAVGEF